MSQTASKSDMGSEAAALIRPWGVSFSFAASAIAGVYYLVYPLLRDVSLYPLYSLGVLSLLASYGLFKMNRWGGWLGAVLYPAQIVAPAFAFLATVEGPGLGSDYAVILFAASLVLLMFLATLSFLFVLDKRKDFK